MNENHSDFMKDYDEIRALILAGILWSAYKTHNAAKQIKIMKGDVFQYKKKKKDATVFCEEEF